MVAEDNLIIRIQKELKTSNLDFGNIVAKSSEGRLIILRKMMRIFIYYSKKKKIRYMRLYLDTILFLNSQSIQRII